MKEQKGHEEYFNKINLETVWKKVKKINWAFDNEIFCNLEKIIDKISLIFKYRR